MTDANPPAADADPPDPSRLRQSEDGFVRALALSRIVVVVPVVTLLFSAFAAFGYGAEVFVRSIAGIFETSAVGTKLGIFLTEIDLFLIGATLIVAAYGLYELFIGGITPSRAYRPLPRWLEITDLNELKARVISMIVLVAAVSFVDVVVHFGQGLQTLYIGAGIALMILALTAFLRFGSDGSGGNKEQRPPRGMP
jgi:uncharacterized membrane protein YqhA